MIGSQRRTLLERNPLSESRHNSTQAMVEIWMLPTPLCATSPENPQLFLTT